MCQEAIDKERSHGVEACYNDQILIVCVHGARELPSLLAKDHKLSGVQVGPERLEVVASFCYLGDILSAVRGFELTVTTCVKTPLILGATTSSYIQQPLL